MTSPGTAPDTGSWRGDARDVGVIIGALAALGVLAGVVWSLVVSTPTVTVDSMGLLTQGVELGRRVEADVWFALLGLAVALPAGVVGSLRAVARGRPDPVVAVLALVGGSLLAALLCSVVGTLLGPSDPATVLQGADLGAQAPEMLTTHTWVVYPVWPLAASTGALVALLVRPPRLPGIGRSDDVSDNTAP
jgi:hypothetical protein